MPDGVYSRVPVTLLLLCRGTSRKVSRGSHLSNEMRRTRGTLFVPQDRYAAACPSGPAEWTSSPPPPPRPRQRPGAPRAVPRPGAGRIRAGPVWGATIKVGFGVRFALKWVPFFGEILGVDMACSLYTEAVAVGAISNLAWSGGAKLDILDIIREGSTETFAPLRFIPRIALGAQTKCETK
jgi:hypothetical protein